MQQLKSWLQKPEVLAGVSTFAAVGGLWIVYASQTSENAEYLAKHEQEKSGIFSKHWDYDKLTKMLQESSKFSKLSINLPCFIVDLSIFDNNVRTLCRSTQEHNKTMRIATKSVRCPYLIHRALDIAKGGINGLMCFSIYEIEFLIEYSIKNNCTNLFNDFMIAYPMAQEKDIELAWNLTQKYGGGGNKNVKISLMVDCTDQILIIEKYCQKLVQSNQNDNENENKSGNDSEYNKIGLCLDLDVCYRQSIFNKEIVSLGAHRSDLHTIEQLDKILECIINDCQYVELYGLMGYEAQIAGFPCNNPFASVTLPNKVVQILKPIFQKQCNNLRLKMVNHVKTKQKLYKNKKNNNISNFYYVNGGGTGNIEICSQDPSVTEVAAGSGLVHSQLFDYYSNVQCMPAACFGLQITRIIEKPKNSIAGDNYIVCQSGGFIASGSLSPDKEPTVFSVPKGIKLETFENEGYGEVQTPLKVTSTIRGISNKDALKKFEYGNAIFFRSSKAGEIGERFNQYVLKDDKYNIVQIVSTYRGMGKAFY